MSARVSISVSKDCKCEVNVAPRAQRGGGLELARGMGTPVRVGRDQCQQPWRRLIPNGQTIEVAVTFSPEAIRIGSGCTTSSPTAPRCPPIPLSEVRSVRRANHRRPSNSQRAVGGLKIYGEASARNTHEGRAKATADAIAEGAQDQIPRSWLDKLSSDGRRNPSTPPTERSPSAYLPL